MAIDDNTSYELTGYQVKDLAQKIRAKADSSSLAPVATSGLYSDLTGAPTIPTVYNGTLTIQQNGTTLGTFSANQDTNETINITGGGGAITTLYWDGQSLYEDSLFQTLATFQDVDGAFTNGVLKISDGYGGMYLGTGYINSNSFIATINADSYNGVLFVLFEYNTTSWDSTRVRFHDFFGATSSTAGTHGFVPAPAAGDESKYLKGDGTWATVQGGSSYTAGNGIDITNGEISVDTSVVATQTDLGSYVTLGTNQNITGEKTFVGDKRIKFKGSATNSKMGFTCYSNTNVETGWMESQGTTAAASKKMRLGIWDTNTGATDNELGFQYRKGNSTYYNLYVAPGYNSPTESTHYIPVGFTDGNTTVESDRTGIVNLSTLLPSYSDFTGATSSTAGTEGLVPAPAAGNNTSFLRGDGTWTTSVDGSLDYSTSEVDTGHTWVDGSKIYKKTIHTGTLPNASSIQVAHGISYSSIIKVEGIAQGNSSLSYTSFSLPFSGSVSNPASYVQIWTDSTNITIATGSDRSAYDSYVTLYYTKSS